MIAGDETPVSREDADALHGIRCKHGRMQNGELRFRLLKSDGTAYIRTEAPPTGSWQKSHFHSKVLETYIVQSGWIVYAEQIDGQPRCQTFRAGQSFTTRPHVVHNIYMPPGAVIHTVKHGDSKGEQRLVNGDCQLFDTAVRKIPESELGQADVIGNPNSVATTLRQEYSEAYRHFDNLIWQVPAWSTAIFAIALDGVISIDGHGLFAHKLEIDVGALTSSLFAFFGVMILALAYTLFRFRWHQIGTKTYVPARPLLSPQVFLQALVLAQGLIFVQIATILAGGRPAVATIFVVGVFVTTTFIVERALITGSKSSDLPISTRS